MSDLVSIALAEFIGKYNREQKDAASKKSMHIVSDVIEAGIALVEAGRYEEAKECFAKAKELEGSDSKNSKSDEDYPREYILE
ncbi:hypothetical protein MSSAC_2801 [Methanosarcina siciliae C2J]|uniref:Tetratricopeptide repeat protein n=2 Tax=Methanosarcina siciliae TaxID=38027 RepID=A0A0E3LDJ7_9EURY|nr:hypothetical protein MSSAC_2801 [Methanosarcina siciliae C2J]